jgi:hypothetical protein
LRSALKDDKVDAKEAMQRVAAAWQARIDRRPGGRAEHAKDYRVSLGLPPTD